jgi:hypothetical protein
MAHAQAVIDVAFAICSAHRKCDFCHCERSGYYVGPDAACQSRLHEATAAIEALDAWHKTLYAIEAAEGEE